MFRETLIESSPQLRKCSRWPMATALTAQIAVAAILIVAPLVTTGVIPLAAHTIVVAPPTRMPIDQHPRPTPTGGRSSGMRATRPNIIAIANLHPTISFGHPAEPVDVPIGAVPTGCCAAIGLPTGIEGADPTPILAQPPVKKPVRVSMLSEAQLVDRVVPEYPMPAQRAGVQGNVKLHAIISRDGSIQSLSVISGHPLLARAAITAVEHWRYRPYFLNGEPVEVETWITVSFTRNQ